MLSNRAMNITPSLTIGINTKVSQLKEQNIDIINLSVGEPDFTTPEKAKYTAVEAIIHDKTRYDKVTGLIELRQAISDKLQNENNISYSLDQIVVSSGAKHAITNALMAVVNPGEEVLIPKPYWVSYPETVKLVGGVPVFVDTDKNNNFKVTPSDLEKLLNKNTKLIILSNPSNPTGAIYTRDELEVLANFCVENGIVILADEIYEKIHYDCPFTSVASLSEKIKDMTITVNGFSKSASMTGWRVGYTASNSKIAKAISSIQGHLVSHPSTISQYAAYGALVKCDEDMNEMVKVFKSRRDLAISLVNEIDGISYVEPDGAFYIFMDISFLKEKFKNAESLSMEFCNQLLEKEGVAVVPGMAFGTDDFIRMCYACSNEELTRGISKIKTFIESL